MNHTVFVTATAQNSNWTMASRFVIVLRFMVAGILLTAAVSKFVDLDSFTQSLTATLLPTFLVFPDALALVSLEILIASLLLYKRTVCQGALLGVFLFATFIIYTGSRIICGAPYDCACFGVFVKLPPPVLLVTDVLLCAFCLFIFRWGSNGGKKTYLVTQEQRDSNFYQIRLPALFCVLLACAIIFANVLPKDPVLQEALTRPFRAIMGSNSTDPIAEAIRRKDPPLMSPMPIVVAPGIDIAKPTIVVMSGDCSLCALSTLIPLEQVRSRQPRINFAMVSSTDISAMMDFSKRYHLRFHIVHDENNRLKVSYNAQWSPRVYLVSSSGRLLWKQNSIRVSAQEVEQAIVSVTGGSKR